MALQKTNSLTDEVAFKMYRGDTKVWRLVFPYDITGMQFTFAMKECVADSNNDSPISVTFESGDTPEDDAVNGIVHIVLESDVSSKLSPSEYHFGIQKTIPATIPKITTLIVGKINILADITQN